MDDTKKMTLAFTGDICLTSVAARDPAYIRFPDWPVIQKAIGHHDFLVGNLECCLIADEDYSRTRPQKMSVPANSAAKFLSASGFTDLNLANNHMLDCGPESIEVTRQQLKSRGIRHFGAGANLQKAEETAYAEKASRKVAFLSACDYGVYYADGQRPGIAPMSKKTLGRRVRKAAGVAELVVVTLHADLEFSRVPGSWRQRLSRWLIDQGANLVIQHHPHVLQGLEHYRHGLIAYSLGNFIFRIHGNAYQERKKGVTDSAILVVEADMTTHTPTLTSRIVPLRIGADHMPHMLHNSEYDAAQNEFKKLSELIDSPRLHRGEWFRRCRKEAIGRMYRVYYALGRRDFQRIRDELRRLLTYREDHRWLLGLVSFGYL